MNGFDISMLAAGLLLLGVAGCNDAPVLRPLSPEAQLVRVESSDPPPGARLAGPIQAQDGDGCGIGGTRGSLANATAALKEAAARRGLGFVKLTRVTKPYSGRDCYHLEYQLVGTGYYLNGAPPAAAPVAPVASTLPECLPPCSPGYACTAGMCTPLCNPACAPEQTCRTDRVCVPGSTP